ncbi:MAG TPA: transglycosylase family protein [Acidimicrobiales bacterium]|nr:transglycosylase family protein [Acidimicrobiales bacterium]
MPRGPVAADQVSDLQAKATQVAKDLVLQQLQVDTYQQQYGADVTKVQQDDAAIGSTESQIQSDTNRVSRDHKRLQSEAVWAYIHLGGDASGTPTIFENQTLAPTRTEYEDVASGDIALTIDSIHIDENRLRAERATLAQQKAEDQATTDQEASLTNSARQTAASLAAQQSEVTGQLAVAVAQQQAAQAAAAQAAIRTAQAKAAAASIATTSRASSTTSTVPQASGSTADPPSTPAADPQLPPFLQCVLQAESGGDYQAVSPDGQYMGGFQFSQATWNEAAQLAGMPQLINVPPNEATPAQQDDLAIALYNADGEQPWNDSCASG